MQALYPHTYLVLGKAGILVGVLVGEVVGLDAEDTATALDEATVEVTDKFPLEINRHYL